MSDTEAKPDEKMEEEKPEADVEADEVDDAPEAEAAPEAPKEPLTINEGVQVGIAAWQQHFQVSNEFQAAAI